MPEDKFENDINNDNTNKSSGTSEGNTQPRTNNEESVNKETISNDSENTKNEDDNNGKVEEDDLDPYEMNSWDELLKFTRRNYLKTVEELTKVQEHTEKSLKQLIETRTSYSKESSNVIKEWSDMLNDSFQKFQSNSEHLMRKARDRAAKELNINIPFQKEIDDFVDSVQKNMKSIFEKLNKKGDE